MNFPKVDLTNCDKEPIHIPGRIQSHGYLIGVDTGSDIITYASSNIGELAGMTAAQLIGKKMSEFFHASSFYDNKINYTEVIEYAGQKDFSIINPIHISKNGVDYNLIIHRSGNTLVLEFEHTQSEIDKELQRVIGISLSKILQAKTIEQTLQFTAEQVREIIGYDRVMVYKFWEDGHGEVMAEEKKEGLEAFMGLHYPASDIPKQARDLYRINLVRIIADVNSTPNDLVAHAAQQDIPLDLTHSTLRAVSPIHIEYLQNMGVAASFSVSIVINDQLWGLIACHNYTPRFIDYKARNSAKLIGQILSSSLQMRIEEEQKEVISKYQLALHEIIRRTIKNWDIPGGLIHQDNNILSLTRATGAALLYENRLYCIGVTPNEDEIREIEKWFRENVRSSIYHTESLSKEYVPAKNFVSTASGVLYCNLSRELHECILWFKPELIKMVKWGGNPDKPMEIDSTGQAKLSPRRSFEVWSQEIAAVSEPWSMAEIGAAMKLREEIVHIISQKANQIRVLNERLQRAYDELDTFSFTISHDLKTPLASIRNYAEILLEDYPAFPDDARSILKKIVKSSDRMNLLIREILSYSRIGRQELKPVPLDISKIIEQAKTESMVALNLQNVEFIVKKTPPINGDFTMISQVFSNLIGNALKYSSKKPKPTVKIEGEDKGGEIIYVLEDNGIGIDMQYGNQVFELFKRLESARSYEGTGVGLAIVKRIMEKHNAKIWYESEPGSGTKFYLSFNNS